MARQNNSIYRDLLNEFNKDLAQTFLVQQESIRKNLYSQIQEERRKRSRREVKVISYYSKIEFPIQNEVMVNQWDVKSIYSTLQELPSRCDIELIIHTLGGLPQKSKQIIEFFKSKLGNKNRLRIVIPEIAKSAGTLIVLGADNITMSTPSELGPIDPQIPRYSGGQVQYVPAWSYIDSFKYLQDNSKDDNGNLKHEFYPLLASFDTPFHQICINAVQETEKVAREFLAEGMLKRTKTKIEEIIKFFLYDRRPHEALIGSNEVIQKLGKSKVELLGENDELWKLYWELHCRICALLDKTSIVKLVEHIQGSLIRQVFLKQN